METIEGHGGDVALAALRAAGVEEMFTLSGGHVFPVYDAAVRQKVRIVDVRHEQTATFAAEGTAKLTRRPGLAVVTAGPGVTNSVSAVTSAYFTGVPLVVLGGRAPTVNWGRGGLQELDHVPILAPVTKLSRTAATGDEIGPVLLDAARAALTPHRGPVFVDVPMDTIFSPASAAHRVRGAGAGRARPGSGRRGGGAGGRGRAAGVGGRRRRLVRPGRGRAAAGGRGVAGARVHERDGSRLPAGRRPAGVRPGARAAEEGGRPRRRGRHAAGLPAGRSATSARPRSCTWPTRPRGSRRTGRWPGRRAATWPRSSTGWPAGRGDRVSHEPWLGRLRAAEDAARAKDEDLLGGGGPVIRRPRSTGRCDPGWSGTRWSSATAATSCRTRGSSSTPSSPACWLDPGPYGCLGTGLGYAIAARVARPSSQVVLLLGDGAAGFSLMDVDTLVRHDLPVVMVVGNNGGWGLEKHPMRAIYGYDVAAELRPETRYDEVVRALGGAGETVRAPGELGPALDRAFASGVPYLVNVLTDPDDSYPRSSVLA